MTDQARDGDVHDDGDRDDVGLDYEVNADQEPTKDDITALLSEVRAEDQEYIAALEDERGAVARWAQYAENNDCSGPLPALGAGIVAEANAARAEVERLKAERDL